MRARKHKPRRRSSETPPRDVTDPGEGRKGRESAPEKKQDEKQEEKVVVGRLGAPYGIKGWIKVASYTDPVDNLARYQPWHWEIPGGWEPVAVSAVKQHGDGLVAALVGVDDRDAANALKGRRIAVAAAALPEPEQDEYYWRDLVGLEVWNLAQQPLGTVREIMPTGGNDVLIVSLGGGSSTDILIPFHRQYVITVDFDQHRIVVDWDTAWQGD